MPNPRPRKYIKVNRFARCALGEMTHRLGEPTHNGQAKTVRTL